MKRGTHAGLRAGGGFSLNVMTEEEFRQIHLASLEILEQTGVFVEDDSPLDIFSDGGCKVEREKHIVKIPPQIVEEAIASSPEVVPHYARNPEHDFMASPGRFGFVNFTEGIKYNDPWTGEYRDPTKKDVGDVARLVDAMDEIVVYDSAIAAMDCPQETYVLHGVEAALLNTSKPVGCEAIDTWELDKCVELAAIAAGGMDKLRERPFIGFGTCAVSPLKLPRDATDVIIGSARHGMLNTFVSMAMSGGSSPVTLAGTLAQHNAEILSGLVLSQLTERGAQFVYGSSTTAMDLRYASACVGSPECAMIGAGVAYIARQYRLPSYIAGA